MKLDGMTSLKEVVDTMKADREEEKKRAVTHPNAKGKTVAEIINGMMSEWHKKIVWKRCVNCGNEYGDLPEDGICGNCRPPKPKPTAKQTTEKDIDEILSGQDAASGESPY